VGRLHLDRGAVRSRALAVRLRVVDAHDDRARHLAGPRRAALAPHVGDDERAAVAAAELRAMVLADPAPLGEPERRGQPRDRLAHVRVDEHRDDERRRDRTVRLQAPRGAGTGYLRRLAKASYDGFFLPSTVSSPDCQPPIDGLSLSRNHVKRSMRGFAFAILYACLTYAACFAQLTPKYGSGGFVW